MARDILQKLNDDEKTKVEEALQEVTTMVNYRLEEATPIKMTVTSQVVTEKILGMTNILKDKEKYKNAFIRKSMYEEERNI